MFININMDREKNKVPKIWHPQQEKILRTWGEAAASYRYMNYQAFLMYKSLSMRFTLPVIVLSTITGTANFAQEQFPLSIRPMVPSIIGGMNLIAGLIATIMQFLKINELMESHRVASQSYGKLSRTIRLELTLPLSERAKNGSDMVEDCRAEYDRLIEQSPPIPKNILSEFEREFPDDSAFYKPEIMHIQPIIPFKAIEENGIIDKLKSAVNVDTKRELKKELNEIRGQVSTVTKRVMKRTPEDEIFERKSEMSELAGKGLVSAQSELMKEIRARTELMEVVTESPKDDESSTQPSKID